MTEPFLSFHTLLVACGIVGGVLFYGRFYVQWIVSEYQKKSVMPVAFWYMSASGVVLLFAHEYHRASPGGTIALCFNIVIYARNLVHIWRERGKLTPARNVMIHAVAAAISLTAAAMTLMTWGKTGEKSGEFWMWIALLGAGQVLFFLRFLVQWLDTERKRRSVIPPAFWYLSFVAAILQGIFYFHDRDWPMAVGMATTLFVYARNIWFVRQEQASTAEAGV